MNWCILIPLLIGLLSALFGYLLGRLFSKGDDHSADIELWRNKNAELETALAACKSSLSASQTNVSSGSSGIANSFAGGAAATAIAFDAGAAKAAFGKNIKQDDLTIVEGIGPKIQELFKENGVHTWKALSETAVSRLQEFLDSRGERYRVHNPGTWPDQAKMAYEGKWAELKKWQDEHDHGKA
jgi:predicted flap endonuclease-1-like 5' DNA nuclease